MESQLRERIQAGMYLLDEQFGGRKDWIDLINPDSLRLADCQLCVIGQIYGDFVTGCQILFGQNHDLSDIASEYGFEVDPEDEEEDYSDLDNAWQEVFHHEQSTVDS